MREVYNYGMFVYEPEKEEEYLKALKGHVKIKVEGRKKMIKGDLTGHFNLCLGSLSKKLKVEQKKQRVFIPLNRIDKIYMY